MHGGEAQFVSASQPLDGGKALAPRPKKDPPDEDDEPPIKDPPPQEPPKDDPPGEDPAPA